MVNILRGKLFNSLAGAVLLALAITSCKEKGVIVKSNGEYNDSTYTANVETPQPRVVLMEEFTGVSCPPCPIGHQALAAIQQQYPNQIAAIGIQVFGFIQAYPVVKDGDTITKHDNRTQAGTELSNGIYGSLGQTPVSGIDRFPRNSNLYIDRQEWGGEVKNRMSIPPLVNLKLDVKYDDQLKTATIKVRAAYTGIVGKRQVLTLALTEDKVIDAQEVGLDVDTFYEHEHVLRDILTQPTGDAVLKGFSVIDAGRVYERTFTYSFSNKSLWKPEDCRFVAYISNNDGSDKQVLQAATAKLK